MKIFWDAEKIIEDMDVIMYAKEKGIPLQQFGSKYYIYCPEHMEKLGKKDRKIGNCKLDKNGYYCFACKARGNGIKLDMLYFKHSFTESCEEIADWLGDRGLYIKSGEYNSTNINVILPINDNEIVALGLRKTVTIKFPTKASLYKNDIANQTDKFYPTNNPFIDYFEEERFLYIKEEEYLITLSELFKENYEVFCEMIWGKALEMIEKYKKIIELDFASIFIQKEKIQQEFELFVYNQYSICKNVLTKFGYAYTGNEPILKHVKKISRFTCI